MLLLVQSHKGSANLGKTCECGVASVADDAAAAATAAIISGTDSDDTVDVAASSAGLSLFCNTIHASEPCNYLTTASVIR